MSCGCTHALVNGVLRIRNRCESHTKRQNPVQELGESYYAEMGCSGQSNHVTEFIQAFGELYEAGTADSFLEIGGGVSPYFHMIRNKGYSYCGVEPSRWACDYMKTHYGVDMICDLFENVYFDGTFSNILACHSLEHVEDVFDVLDRIYSFMKEAGSLFVIVPDGVDVYNPDHVWFFTPSSLSSAVSRAGFTVNDLVIQHVDPKEDFLYLKATK